MRKSRLKYFSGVLSVVVIGLILTIKGCGHGSGEYLPYCDIINGVVGSDVLEEVEKNEKIEEYLKFYGLEMEGVKHEMFRFGSGEYVLMGHFFEPESGSDDLVAAVHGYMSHIRQMKNLVQELVGKGYAVGCFDLPGHGLSSGARGSILSFDEYSEALADFLEIVKGRYFGKCHLLGFSTGGSAVIDYLLCGDGGERVDKVILVSPLVHSYGWGVSKFGYDMTHWILKRVPNMYVTNSGNEEYVELVKNDPLVVREIPVEWLEALYEWNEKIEGCQKSDKSIKMIQGDDDSTVDGEYNISFLKGKFANIEVVMIEGGKHELLNEKLDLREKVFEEITEYLEN